MILDEAKEKYKTCNDENWKTLKNLARKRKKEIGFQDLLQIGFFLKIGDDETKHPCASMELVEINTSTKDKFHKKFDKDIASDEYKNCTTDVWNLLKKLRNTDEKKISRANLNIIENYVNNDDDENHPCNPEYVYQESEWEEAENHENSYLTRYSYITPQKAYLKGKQYRKNKNFFKLFYNSFPDQRIINK